MGDERSHAARNTELLGEAGFCWDWPDCVPPLVCFKAETERAVKSDPWIAGPHKQEGLWLSVFWGCVQDSPQLVTNCTLSVIPPQRKAMVSVILAM